MNFLIVIQKGKSKRTDTGIHGYIVLDCYLLSKVLLKENVLDVCVLTKQPQRPFRISLYYN